MSAIDKVMYVFPGQGSQYPGMGKDLYQGFETAREIFDQANDILNYDLVRIAFKDPDDQIGLTRYTQPILLTHQIACLRVFQEFTGSKITPVLSAGHSLGEYTALIIAVAQIQRLRSDLSCLPRNLRPLAPARFHRHDRHS